MPGVGYRGGREVGVPRVVWKGIYQGGYTLHIHQEGYITPVYTPGGVHSPVYTPGRLYPGIYPPGRLYPGIYPPGGVHTGLYTRRGTYWAIPHLRVLEGVYTTP